jgi:hypothetical protein
VCKQSVSIAISRKADREQVRCKSTLPHSVLQSIRTPNPRVLLPPVLQGQLAPIKPPEL